MRAAVVVPAFQAERAVADVVAGLVRIWPDPDAVLVVDDGSTDRTSARAREAGAVVLRHERNLGKGAALRTGLRAALDRHFHVVVSVDADGQHPPTEALRLRGCCPDPAALVIGVRDLDAARAPRPNRLSNAFSNFAVSGFAWKRLQDTQCGLRRYPLATTLGLGASANGYGFEAEVLIRAAAAGIPIVQVPVRVIYPPEAERITHFDPVWDPTLMVFRVIATSALTRIRWLRTRVGRRVARALGPGPGAQKGEPGGRIAR
jgi:glycosyltransferase involved in cell wall biosynthesis